jgi:hypothetical protein
LPVLLVLLTAAAVGREGTPEYVVIDGPQITHYWKSTGNAERLQLPKSFIRTHADGCVAVGYSIEADGNPANLVVLRAAYSAQADKIVAADLEQLVVKYFAGRRYAAASSNPQHKPVYTYGYYSFSAVDTPSTNATVDKHSDFVRAHCVIADFPAAVARGDLLKKAS